MAPRGAVRQARGSAVEYLRKGAQVYIEGQLRTRSWEDNGITRYVTEILLRPRHRADAGTCTTAERSGATEASAEWAATEC